METPSYSTRSRQENRKTVTQTKRPGTSKAGMNGVTLDQREKPSLEVAGLHYAKQAPGLFTTATVQTVYSKLSGHNGPRFQGPWP